MAVVVEIETSEGFILDDPIAGVLDNDVYTLGGESFADITSFMSDTNITRGKNRDLDRYSAGQCTVRLNNRQRTFDPLYAAGPYFGQIVPRRRLRVTVDGEREFTGVIDDWNFDYDPGGDSVAEIVATDNFTLLARQLLTPGTASTQTTGARVSAVLDMSSVNWSPDERNISAGQSVLGNDVFEGNALDYLQKVTTSEQGELFISKTGELTFRDRLDATPTSDSLITFADDGTGIDYTLTAVNFGTELLINTAEVTSAAGTAVAQNNRSRISYGVSAESLETLVNSQAQLENLADFIVSKYADPEYRFGAIRVNLDSIPSVDKATVLGLELGDVIKIVFTPNGIGSPIEQFGEVIRFDNQITRDRHDVVIGVESLDWTFLVLNDLVFGTLDDNNLAF
jgi:hypothetical protein